MYEFSNSVILLGSSRDMVMHLGDEELRYKSRETTVQQNSSNQHKEVKIAWLHQYIFMLLLHLLTLSGRFRFGFGVGDMSNTIDSQWFSNLSYKHPCPAHFVCLPYQTHLIQLISSLVETTSPESGVYDKGDIQNVQGRGACRTGLKTTAIEH